MTDATARGTLVTGDFIIDQHIYEGQRYRYCDPAPGVLVKVEVGGAGKLADLLSELFQNLTDPSFDAIRDVVPSRVPPPSIGRAASGDATATPLAHHAYAFWRRCPVGEKLEKQTWHCVEAMGFGASPPLCEMELDAANACGISSSDAPCVSWSPHPEKPDRPKLIVISDGGMGFRDNSACWEQAALPHAEHIVFKTANQPTTSRLWDELTRHAERLTVILSAAELRKTDARISSGLTWEATFQDLLRELAAPTIDRAAGQLHELTNCRTLIVTFDNEAAVAIEFPAPRDLSGATVSFVYRGSEIEEDIRHLTPGTAFGFLTCFTAAIAYGIARQQPVATGMMAGLSAMRNLLARGHGAASDRPTGFPCARICDVIQNPQDPFVSIRLPVAELDGSSWTFLKLAEPGATSRTEPAYELARLTAIYGLSAIRNLPHLTVGQLMTVDGEEITALRSLRQVLRRYCETPEENKPLSIGIFGPPGSGKSFAVKQIANHMLGKKAHWLDFNLSQFEGPADLIGAFHQIRDAVLQGKLPVAFFDEFDSRRYEWLQYLLAPMQDGKFQEGESTHTVGRCVFVFAGGTSWTFETFGPAPTDAAQMTQFIQAKGPDFKSRLDAFLNVVGPNPRVRELHSGGDRDVDGDGPPFKVGGRWMDEDRDDIWWPIRRALFLRSKLNLTSDQKLEMAPGLLSALLRVPRYRHGARSLEKILFSVRSASTFTPSFVPNRAQLELHTSADVFLNQLNDPGQAPIPVPDLDPDVLEAFASAIHGTWNEFMIQSGYRKRADARSLDQERQELQQAREAVEAAEAKLAGQTGPDAVRVRAQIAKDRKRLAAKHVQLESNTGAAARMPRILAAVGLRLVPGTDPSAANEAQVRRVLEFHLDLLASEEHREWMAWYFDRGWTYHPKRDDAERRHNSLKPYSELPELERQKDQSAIRHYPDFARRAGYHIEPIA